MENSDATTDSKLLSEINQALSKRAGYYSGEFFEVASISSDLKTAIRHHVFERDTKLQPDQWEALDLICHKIGWIIQCDPNCEESWGDISDLAMLVSDRIRRNAKDGLKVVPLKKPNPDE